MKVRCCDVCMGEGKLVIATRYAGIPNMKVDVCPEHVGSYPKERTAFIQWYAEVQDKALATMIKMEGKNAKPRILRE